MAAVYNISIDAGADSDVRFSVSDPNGSSITDCTFKMQLRKNHMSGEVVDELSTANGRITVDEDGVAHLRFSAARSDEIRGFEGYYDIFMTDPTGLHTKILQGTFKCLLQITR